MTITKRKRTQTFPVLDGAHHGRTRSRGSCREYEILLGKARGEFARVASMTGDDTTPHCPASTLVECLYWDVQTLERGGTLDA